jgi:PAS domain S-box-containing protein
MRLMVVDDHEVVRRGVRSLLLERVECEICGEAVDGQDAVEKARELVPDVVVMDVSMPRLNGLEATRQLRNLLPQCEILILSQHESPEMARQALKAGARGYVVKSSISKDLISALRKVSNGEYFFDPSVLEEKASAHIDVQEILQRSAAFERALRESEELYRSTFDLSAVGIAHVDPDGKWLRVNTRLCEIVGYTESELVNITFQDITHPDDLAVDLQQAEKVRDGKLATYSMEKRYIRKDGRVIWINLTVSGVRDSSGKLKHFIAVVEDINERKHAEQALSESKKQLVLALKSSKSAMFDWDVVGRCGKWNSEMRALYGFEPKGEYITAEEWMGLFHPDDRIRLAEEANRIWRDKHPLDFTFEFRTVPHHDKTRWITSHGRIVRNAEGNAIRMIGIHTDITERRLADESLRQRETELKEAQRLAKIGSWHWTPATDTVIWSDELYRIAGRDPRLPAVSYEDHPKLYTPESWERLQAAVNEALNNGTPYSVELEMVRPNGEKRWVTACGEAQRDSQGTVVALRGTVQDITDRKRMEEELRKGEERTRFSLETANIGTWEWDVQTGEVRWSSNMEAVHGQAPGSFGNSFDSFFEGVFIEDRERVVQEIKTALAGTGIYKTDYRQYRSDGTLGWMEVDGRVEFDRDGKPLRMFGVCANVTERKQAEEQLKRSESRLRAAFSQSYSFLSLLEPNGTIIEINRAALEAAGVSDASQVVGRKLWEASWWSSLPDEVEVLKQTISEVATGHSVHAECRFCLPDGTIRVGDRTLSPILDDDGRVVMIVAMGLDITERKQNETAIATAARQQKALFHLADELHRAGSLEDVYNAALNAILDALQCNRASILLCDDAGVMHFKSWRGLSKDYRGATDGHSAWRPNETNPQPICVTDINTADLSESLKAVVKKEGIGALAFIPLVSDGKLTGKFMAYFNAPHQFAPDEIDVSLTIARQLSFAIQRCKTDENLRESNKAAALWGAIVTFSDDAIISKNLDGIIQSWNSGAERIFGFKADEAIGRHITLIIPEDRHAEEDHILSCLRRGERIDHFETVRRRKDGSLIDASVTISPVYDSSGRVIGASKVARDITAQKRAAEKVRVADEAVRLMKAQDEERRRIARDFHDSAGQTLTVLGLSIAELVQEAEGVAPRLAEKGKHIEEVVQQLHREIRTTSYLLHPPLLDEAGLSSALNWYVQGLAERSGMKIDLNISDDFGRLPADMELAIFRIVQECLTNIHRHAESKTAFIRMARENGSICVEVRDEGKGISPERLVAIQSRGSGVGVAGIRERLRQFGGEMQIESNGSGTTVFAAIPLPKEAGLPDAEPLQTAV